MVIIILKIFLSFIDLILVLLLSPFAKVYLIFNNKFFRKNKIQEIYSIYYWQTRRSDSITYYYPDFMKKNNRSAYIAMFSGYRFVFRGLLDALLEKRILTALDFIDFKIFQSINIFIKIYLRFFNKEQFTFGGQLQISIH